MRKWKCVNINDGSGDFTVGKTYESDNDGYNIVSDNGYKFENMSVAMGDFHTGFKEIKEDKEEETSKKFKCIKSYASGEWLTKDNVYELGDNGIITYDDGWTDTFKDTDKFGEFGGTTILGNYLIEIKEEDNMKKEEKLKKMYDYCKDNHCYYCKVEKKNKNHSCGCGKGYSNNNPVSDEELNTNYNIAFEEIKDNNNQKSIHITFDNTTTHAILKDGKDVIKRAKVGLYYEDEYKFETGVMEVVKKLLDIKEDDKEEEVKPFVKAKVGDRIRIVNNNGEHYPEVNDGDIHKVVEVWESWVNTNKENSFMDDDKEYEIIESIKDLSDYTTDELLAEIRIRSVR
jgi:hypothetical protein